MSGPPAIFANQPVSGAPPDLSITLPADGICPCRPFFFYPLASPLPPPMPKSQDSDPTLLRKKKNADAQAAFRARRQNYISTLEETGIPLVPSPSPVSDHSSQSPVSSLSSSSSKTRAERPAIRTWTCAKRIPDSATRIASERNTGRPLSTPESPRTMPSYHQTHTAPILPTDPPPPSHTITLPAPASSTNTFHSMTSMHQPHLIVLQNTPPTRTPSQILPATQDGNCQL